MSGVLRNFMAGAALGLSMSMPSIGGYHGPSYVAAQATYRDGLGRRKKKPDQPQHERFRKDKRYQDFCAAVRHTHSDRPDPREDKYLNSFARRMRVQYPNQVAQELFA